jgi:hypothetical protein
MRERLDIPYVRQWPQYTVRWAWNIIAATFKSANQGPHLHIPLQSTQYSRNIYTTIMESVLGAVLSVYLMMSWCLRLKFYIYLIASILDSSSEHIAIPAPVQNANVYESWIVSVLDMLHRSHCYSNFCAKSENIQNFINFNFEYKLRRVTLLSQHLCEREELRILKNFCFGYASLVTLFQFLSKKLIYTNLY